jgi:hypothetical protein
MTVWCRQLNDGRQSGDEYLIAPVTDESDLALLNRKATSHAAFGWTVTWLGPQRFRAVKPDARGGRDRLFSVR